MKEIITDLNEQLSELQEKLKHALEENKRLRSLHEARKNEIENLKIKLTKENTEDDYESTREELKRQDLEMKELANQYEIKIEEFNTQISQLQGLLDNKSKENNRLNQLLADRKKENETLKASVSSICFL